MYGKIQQHLAKELEDIKNAGLFKKERIITSAQGAEITINTGKKFLIFVPTIIWGFHLIRK